MNRLTITTVDGKEHTFETDDGVDDYNALSADEPFAVNDEAIFNMRYVVSMKFDEIEDDETDEAETDANPGDPAPEQKKREVLGGLFNRK